MNAVDTERAQVFELFLRLGNELLGFGRRHLLRRLRIQSRIRSAASVFESVGSSTGSPFCVVIMVIAFVRESKPESVRVTSFATIASSFFARSFSRALRSEEHTSDL